MASVTQARLHRSRYYDGTNGALVVADIPGASLQSGGTGNTTLVIDIAGAGQASIPPQRHIVWTEYPGTPVQVLDTNLADAQLAQVYGAMADVAAIAAMQTTVSQLASGQPLTQKMKATTAANGVASFTWPTAFSATPTVALAIQTTTAEVHTTRITACSTTGATVHVARSPIIAVVGINVTAAMVDAAGVVVHAIACGAP